MGKPILVTALAILTAPSICFAWGGEAHQLIALIAEEKMTPEARAAVKELLDGGNISDAEVASWADEIRRERRETADWHYVNIPHDAGRFDRARDGRGGENVIDKPAPAWCRLRRIDAHFHHHDLAFDGPMCCG